MNLAGKTLISIIVGVVALLPVTGHTEQAKHGTLFQDPSSCSRPDESPVCALKTFWACMSGDWLENCEAVGIPVSDGPHIRSDDSGTSVPGARERPWSLSWNDLFNAINAGMDYVTDIGPRQVGRDRFKGVRQLPFKHFPVTEMAYYGYDVENIWSAESVFVAQRSDGTWKVVGFARWEEPGMVSTCDRQDRLENPFCKIAVHGLQLPWNDLQIHDKSR